LLALESHISYEEDFFSDQVKPLKTLLLNTKMGPSRFFAPQAIAWEGSNVGGYLIGEKVFSGSMCDLHSARDQHDEKSKAFLLKALQPRYYYDARAALLLHHEALILEKLNQLAIPAPTLYLYSHESDQPCLIMERLSGFSLDRLSDHLHMLTFAEIQKLIKQLYHLLWTHHEHGIIHGDLKAGNIVFSLASMTPYFVDYGGVYQGKAIVAPPFARWLEPLVSMMPDAALRLRLQDCGALILILGSLLQDKMPDRVTLRYVLGGEYFSNDGYESMAQRFIASLSAPPLPSGRYLVDL
jgi:serine/threonine protein kinase